MVKHSALLSMTRLVLDMSSPAPNARLVHVEIVEGRPFGGVVFLGSSRLLVLLGPAWRAA